MRRVLAWMFIIVGVLFEASMVLVAIDDQSRLQPPLWSLALAVAWIPTFGILLLFNCFSALVQCSHPSLASTRDDPVKTHLLFLFAGQLMMLLPFGLIQNGFTCLPMLILPAFVAFRLLTPART